MGPSNYRSAEVLLLLSNTVLNGKCMVTCNYPSTTVYGPHHSKTCLLEYAGSEGPEQPVPPCSLIMAFGVR